MFYEQWQNESVLPNLIKVIYHLAKLLQYKILCRFFCQQQQQQVYFYCRLKEFKRNVISTKNNT